MGFDYGSRPVVIEARGVEKTFRIPDHRVDTFKERALHPFAGSEHRELRALRGLSFDVHQGEFFGIVGRNGSGKSTLLKIMSSIYRADGGRVRMAGRLAPFIELGVGFNPELTSRENVVLNGVMMGLTRREAQRRLDGVLDFAELRDFVDLRLKNYSSGMMVRLAFAVMVEADGDTVFGFNRTLKDGPDRLAAGDRVRIAGTIENPLLPGRYFVTCWISRNRTQGDLALHIVRLLDFVVYGTRPGPGTVTVRADVEVNLERQAAPWP